MLEKIKTINQIILKIAYEVGVCKNYIASKDEILSFIKMPTREHFILKDWRGDLLKKKLEKFIQP